MTPNQQALNIYAAIGELTVKTKQYKQQIAQWDDQLSSLESELIRLCNAESKESEAAKEPKNDNR